MKIIAGDIAVLDDDTHISRWVQQKGKLNIAEGLILPFKKWIPDKGVVVDGGANIGDHTVTYSRLVGIHGKVLSFEPNPSAFKCLEYNTRKLRNVSLYQYALAESEDTLGMTLSPNVGASWCVPQLVGADEIICCMTLDRLKLERLDFLKLDVEGFEYRALCGARETISRFRPAILCEINQGALERDGWNREYVAQFLEEHEYSWEIVDSRCKWTDPQFDIFCTSKL